MKKTVILLLLWQSLGAGAQTTDSLVAYRVHVAKEDKSALITINEEDAQKCKTVNELLNFPPGYQVLQYDASFVSPGRKTFVYKVVSQVGQTHFF